MRKPTLREAKQALAYQRGEVALVPQWVAELADTRDEAELEELVRSAREEKQDSPPPPRPPHLRTPGEVFSDWEKACAPYRRQR